VRILSVNKPDDFVKIFVIFGVFFFCLYSHTTRHARALSSSCLKVYPKYRFEISRVAKIHILVFSVITAHCLVDEYLCVRGRYCLDVHVDG
jgi:hypothetical protein